MSLNGAPRVQLYAFNKLRDRVLQPAISLGHWAWALQSGPMPGDLHLLPEPFGELACSNTVPRFYNNLEYISGSRTSMLILCN